MWTSYNANHTTQFNFLQRTIGAYRSKPLSCYTTRCFFPEIFHVRDKPLRVNGLVCFFSSDLVPTTAAITTNRINIITWAHLSTFTAAAKLQKTTPTGSPRIVQRVLPSKKQETTFILSSCLLLLCLFHYMSNSGSANNELELRRKVQF